MDFTADPNFFQQERATWPHQGPSPTFQGFSPRVDPRMVMAMPGGPMVSAGGLSNCGGGVLAFCRSHTSMLVVVFVIIIALVIGFMVYRTRNKVMGTDGPHSDIIKGISSPEVKADAQEVQYLFQVAKRPNIKAMLEGTLQSFNSNKQHTKGLTTDTIAEDHGDFEVMGMSAREAIASGEFEPL